MHQDQCIPREGATSTGLEGQNSSLVIVVPPEDPAVGTCSGCDGEISFAEGPIGWNQAEAGGPLCDSCLLIESPALGMMIRSAQLALELGADPKVLENPKTSKALARFYVGYFERFAPPIRPPTRSTGLLHLIKVLQVASDLDPLALEILVDGLENLRDESEDNN